MPRYRGLTLQYELESTRLPEHLRDRVLRLELDDDTRAWMDECHARPSSAVARIKQKMARAVMSDFDANALAGTHDMHVFSPSQWRTILDEVGAPRGRLLDVGAGDGNVTQRLAPAFDAVVCTETSAGMARKLRARGYECHEVDLVERPLFEGSGPAAEPFDVIAMLNVLDRTARPLSLLANLRALLAPGGRLITTVPLPLSPHVHVGNRTVDPEERLPADRRSFEAQVAVLADLAFRGSGFETLRVARVPYLCRGFAERPVMTLDASVFVLATA